MNSDNDPYACSESADPLPGVPMSMEAMAAESIAEWAKTGTRRPRGLVDWLHEGGYFRDDADGAENGQAPVFLSPIEHEVDKLDHATLAKLSFLVEERAWSFGRSHMLRVGERLWPRLSPRARGQFLAGLSLECNPAGEVLALNKEFAAWTPAAEMIYRRLPSADLDAAGAAEIGANAIRRSRMPILERLLERTDLPEVLETRVPPQESLKAGGENNSWQNTRLLDVLLEAAVSFRKPDAVRLLLEHGASPDITLWKPGGHWRDWASALSYTIFRIGTSVVDGRDERAVFDALMAFGANAQGLRCEGWNRPLMLAMRFRLEDIEGRLRDAGACTLPERAGKA
jgi:hypothetical protein